MGSAWAQEDEKILEKYNKLDEALAESPLYKDCQSDIDAFKNEADKQSQVAECFEKNLKNYEDKDIEELGKGLDISSFGVKDVKNANSIREFLTERLRKGLYGSSYDKTTKKVKTNDRKQVGHDKYLELYKSQLSKTVLLEVNRYCLENLRLESGETIKDTKGNTILLKTPDVAGNIPTVDSTTSKDEIIKILDEQKWTEQKFVYTRLDEFDEVTKNKLKNLSPMANSNSKTIGEYANTYNTEQDVEKNKTSPDEAKYLAKKQSLCIAALNIMCTCYEKECKENNGHKVGQIACSVKSKIRSHRSKMEAVNQGIDTLNDQKIANKGFNSQNIKYYSGKGSGEKSIDELTNVTSTEISEQVKGLEEEEILEAKAKLDECKGGNLDANENCEALFGEELTELRKEDILKLQADKAKGVEEINKVEAGDEFRKYLENNGHKDLLTKLDAGELSEEKIRELITEKFKAEKQSIIDQMNEKLAEANLGQKQKPGSNQSDGTTSDDPFTPKTDDELIEQEKTKVEIKRDRFADVLHYSNVISSYLQLKDQDNKVIGQNTLALKQEYEQFKDSENQTELENQYWENLTADANAPQDFDQSGSSEIDIPMIDRILGGDTSTDNNKD